MDGITDSVVMNLSKLLETVKDREEPGMLQATGSQRVAHDSGSEQQTTHAAGDTCDEKALNIQLGSWASISFSPCAHSVQVGDTAGTQRSLSHCKMITFQDNSSNR